MKNAKPDFDIDNLKRDDLWSVKGRVPAWIAWELLVLYVELTRSRTNG